MSSNLILFLPLLALAGYVFTHLCHFLKYRAQALTGQRLVFEAAGYGIFGFFLLARAILLLIADCQWFQQVMRQWTEIVGSTPHLGSCLLSVFLAAGLGGLLNLSVGAYRVYFGSQDQAGLFEEGDEVEPSGSGDIGTPRRGALGAILRRLGQEPRRWWKASQEYALERAVRARGNALQRLLYDAAIQGLLDGTTVGLSLANGKVYTAFVLAPPTLSAADDYLEILPILSGYRDSETKIARHNYLYPVEHPQIMAVPVSAIQAVHRLPYEFYQKDLQRFSSSEETESS